MPQGGFHLTFGAVYTDSEENKMFFKYTPAITVMLQTVNEEAAKNFEQGQEYYLDFIPAED